MVVQKTPHWLYYYFTDDIQHWSGNSNRVSYKSHSAVSTLDTLWYLTSPCCPGVWKWKQNNSGTVSWHQIRNSRENLWRGIFAIFKNLTKWWWTFWRITPCLFLNEVYKWHMANFYQNGNQMKLKMGAFIYFCFTSCSNAPEMLWKHCKIHS